MKNWMIVRCNNRATLSVAAKMLEHGIRAWVPIEVKRQRLPRRRITLERKFPLLPGMVFVQQDDWGMVELYQRIHMFREIRAMTLNGAYCIVANAQLDPLRRTEFELQTFAVGDVCEIVNSIFDGLCSIIALAGKHYVKVKLYNNSTEIKISTSLLRKVHS